MINDVGPREKAAFGGVAISPRPGLRQAWLPPGGAIPKGCYPYRVQPGMDAARALRRVAT